MKKLNHDDIRSMIIEAMPGHLKRQLNESVSEYASNVEPHVYDEFIDSVHSSFVAVMHDFYRENPDAFSVTTHPSVSQSEYVWEEQVERAAEDLDYELKHALQGAVGSAWERVEMALHNGDYVTVTPA